MANCISLSTESGGRRERKEFPKKTMPNAQEHDSKGKVCMSK